MDYKTLRSAKAPAGRKEALPLRNLEIAKEVDGELVGDAYLIEGKELKDISGQIYKQAAAQDVKVALRTDPKNRGVLVFRIKKPKEE